MCLTITENQEKGESFFEVRYGDIPLGKKLDKQELLTWLKSFSQCLLRRDSGFDMCFVMDPEKVPGNGTNSTHQQDARIYFVSKKDPETKPIEEIIGWLEAEIQRKGLSNPQSARTNRHGMRS